MEGAMTPAERHKALRKAKQEMKRRLGVACPHCAAMPKGPPPRVLMPQELCTTHNYRDPRPRLPENDYQSKVKL